MAQDPRSIGEIRDALAQLAGASLRSALDTLSGDPRVGVRAACRAAASREESRAAENKRLRRLYRLEQQLHSDGFVHVAGVDEVGRGALAGPLTAGACVLPDNPRIEGLNDSKKLSPAKREQVALQVCQVAISWSVAHVDPHDVDALGVTAAVRRAMGRAVAGLGLEPDHVVVDGLPIGLVPGETAVVAGDSKVAAIAAASVIAKVARDRLMIQLALQHPGYGFEINKGYGTSDHLAAIASEGLSAVHRVSFCPGGGTDTLF